MSETTKATMTRAEAYAVLEADGIKIWRSEDRTKVRIYEPGRDGAYQAARVSSFVRDGVGVVSARRATRDKFGNPEVGAVPAFVSHFSTCVTAHEHRKPREPKPPAAPAPTTRELFPSKPFTGGDPS